MSITSNWVRRLGDTDIEVSALALGTSPMGHTRGADGYRSAIDTVKTALSKSITVIDTANGYGAGESERRVGAALRELGGLPRGALVVTKVDPKGLDYSGERVRQSVRESKERLGLDSLPLVHLHDPEGHDFAAMTGPGGAVEALVRLREEGEIGLIGLAGGPIPLMRRYLALDNFDALLVHNRWTLVDRSAAPILAEARAKGVAVINAAVYGGGILVDPARFETYAYQPVKPEVRQAIDALTDLCSRSNVGLSAAALQFSLRDPQFAFTVVGMSAPARVERILAAAAVDIPDEFWSVAETLLPSPEFWLEPPS